MSFDQLRLDSTVPIGVEELTKAKQRVQELETQVTYYEKRDFEHKELQGHMRNSYSSFIREQESLKKNLALAELRCQELKEENLKLNAQLSGRIDLLLNERHVYQDLLAKHNGQTWFVAERPTVVFMGFLANRYEKIQLTIDTETNEVGKLMGINLLPGKSA